MTQQCEFSIKAHKRGFNLVTKDILRAINNEGMALPESGILNLFIKHTSCGLALSENYDPDVQHDLEEIFNHMVPENAPYYYHTMEGSDDMPSHAKSIIVGPSLSIPITNGRLNLGTWQGIYLCEFRNSCPTRQIIATSIN